VKLHESARKHYTRDRLTDDVVLYAVEHALLREPLDERTTHAAGSCSASILRGGFSSSSSSPSTPGTS
jgi:hypothetical protein